MSHTDLSGAPPRLAYQPQCLRDEIGGDVWWNIGFPTVSKQVTRDRLRLHLSIHRKAKVRVLKIESHAEVIDTAGDPLLNP